MFTNVNTWLGVSTKPIHPFNPPDLPEPEPTNPTVGGGSPPSELDPFGSASGFPPQKPEPPDPTIKSTKSGEIERFSDKELLEIHQIRQDLVKIYSRFDRFSQILARSRPIRRNISTNGEISEPAAKPEIEPTPTRNPTDLNRMTRPLKRVGLGFDYYPPEKFGSGSG